MFSLAPTTTYEGKILKYRHLSLSPKHHREYKKCVTDSPKATSAQQNFMQHLPPERDTFLLVLFHLEKRKRQPHLLRYQVINISTWRDFLDSFLSVTLYLPRPDDYICQFCLPNACLLPLRVRPHPGGPPSFRLPVLFPIPAPTGSASLPSVRPSPGYHPHCTEGQLPERHSGHVPHWHPGTPVLELSSPPSVTGSFPITSPTPLGSVEWGRLWALSVTVSPGPALVLCAKKCLLIMCMRLKFKYFLFF